MRKFFFAVLLVLAAGIVSAQVTVTGSTGADGIYTSLSKAGGAFAALNAAGSQTGKTITVSITANTSGETGANSLHGSGWTSLTIIPVGARQVAGAPAKLMICLYNTQNVTIDGLNTGGNSLIIANTTSDFAAADTDATIAFMGDASYNTIRNCTIQGNMRGTVGNTISKAIILFGGGGTTTGCDNNLIQNNNIGSSNAVNYPAMAIASWGTSATITNDNNTIDNNHIYDYYCFARYSAGIIMGSYSSGWSITNNRFYQTVDRSTASNNFRLRTIYIITGGGYTITGNTIGYKDASGTSPWTDSGAMCTVIEMSVDATPVSLVQGNVINGIHWSSNAIPDVFYGIYIASGGVIVQDNTIGAPSGTGTPTSNMYLQGIYTLSSTTYTIIPILVTSSTSCIISGNTIAAIGGEGNSTEGLLFTAIQVSGSGNHIVNGNTIGSATSGSISIGKLGTGSALCDLVGIQLNSSGISSVGSLGAGNSIQNLNLNSPTGFIKGIWVNGAVSGTSNVSSNTVDNLYLNDNSNPSDFNLIEIDGANFTSTLNIQNNIIGSNAASIGSTGGTGNLYGITQTGMPSTLLISGNVFNNVTFNSTGKVSLINVSYSDPGTGSRVISNNTINGFSRTIPSSLSTSGFYGIYNYCATSWAPTFINGNIITNISANQTGSNGVYGISSSYDSHLSFTDNSVSGVNSSNSSIYMIYVASCTGTVGSPCQITGNNVSGNSASGSVAEIAGVYLDSGCSNVNINGNDIETLNCGIDGLCTGIHLTNGSGIKVFNNTIKNNSNSGTGNVQGIYVGAGTGISLYQNYIHDLGAQGQVSGIYVAGGTSVDIYNHQLTAGDNYSIHALTSGSSIAPANGIAVMGGSTVNVRSNKIYDLSNTTTSSNPGLVNGILLGGGSMVNVNNNIIGGLNAGSSSSTDAIRAISVTSSQPSATYNLYYNTVMLNAFSTGTDFGSSAIYHAASATPSIAAMDLRNNLLQNNSIPSGSGLSCVIRSSGTAMNNFTATSNNNILYAGVPCSSHPLYTDGSNSEQTLGDYKSWVSPREAGSFTENTQFISTTCTDAAFLHVNPTLSTYAESGAINIGGITTDMDGDPRQGNPGYTGSGTAPDIGADEFGMDMRNWNGTISDNWNEPLNWTPALVPTSTTNVIIPSGTPFPCLVRDWGMVCNDITVHGPQLTINLLKGLTVGGKMTLLP